MMPRMTILFDNYPGTAGLATLWGFAALVETPQGTVLFDTGSNGRVLLKNMAALGIRPESIDILVLSHPHWDHMGGLDSVLEINPDLRLVLHEGFSKHLVEDLGPQCRALILVGEAPQELAPGLWSTGMLGRGTPDGGAPEQALVIVTPGSVALISGCAHPGMEAFVERAAGFLGRRVDWAIGGFHLMDADAERIAGTIADLERLGVRSLVPTHCTGELAVAACRRAYGERCLAGGAGRRYVLG